MTSAVIARLVHASTAAQQLPARIEDPTTVKNVAVFLDVPVDGPAKRPGRKAAA